jgi:hypothetical protein
VTQRRDLEPRTVYLPPAAIKEAEERAKMATVPVSTMLRMILLGQQHPLDVRGSR